MAELIEYKCPNCGGAIEFSSELQKLKCPFCETEFELSALKAYDESLKVGQDDISLDETPGAEWLSEEQEGMALYVCKSCGGEIITDKNTSATACPYCGNNIVMTGNLSGELRPDLVIPFKKNREEAKSALFKHFKGKTLLPKVFKSENHIDEIKGVYVPFWLFSANAAGDISFRATRVRSWSDSRYNYTETSHYSVRRSGEVDFSSVPCDGSSKMDDALMDSLEPFDMTDAVDFQTAYLAGYLADKFDVTAADSRERAQKRMKKSVEEAFQKSVSGYATVAVESSAVTLKNARAKYALFPVWLLNTTWRGNRYVFAMNGQTGKLVGDLPVDKGKAARMMWGVTALAAALAAVIIHFTGVL